MIQQAIHKIVEGHHLTEAEAGAAMEAIMSGQATPAQIGALITALRMKGETVDEIAGFARVMREKADRITPTAAPIVDTCGTGGDGAHTFNISTTAAFVVAAAGAAVAKHGNRSVSSKCGSADVLEALGVRIDLEPEAVRQCIEQVGIGFLFAPRFHASMRHAIGPRREVGIRSVFNLLGPLTNPASAHAQVVGVYDPALTHPLAHVLSRLGVREAYVVHGLERIDEISISGETQVSHLKDGTVTTFRIRPEDAGLQTADQRAMSGGDAQENAAIVRSILKGESGPRRDVVLLNASAALVVAGLASDLKEGVAMAADAIDSGRAHEKLEALIDFTRSSAA